MKVDITFNEIEKLVEPSIDTSIKFEYISLNCVRVKYSKVSVKLTIKQVHNEIITINYELDKFRNVFLKVANYFFNFKNKMNPNIFEWDLDKKLLNIDVAQVKELKEFKGLKNFKDLIKVDNVLVNSLGLLIYFKVDISNVEPKSKVEEKQISVH